MILGDYNVALNFARDTCNYLTDPHHQSRKVINQWLYNSDFVDVYDKLLPGKSSYTWSRSAEIALKDGDKNIRSTAWEKKSRIDHILLSPALLPTVKKNLASEDMDHLFF